MCLHQSSYSLVYTQILLCATVHTGEINEKAVIIRKKFILVYWRTVSQIWIFIKHLQTKSIFLESLKLDRFKRFEGVRHTN